MENKLIRHSALLRLLTTHNLCWDWNSTSKQSMRLWNQKVSDNKIKKHFNQNPTKKTTPTFLNSRSTYNSAMVIMLLPTENLQQSTRSKKTRQQWFRCAKRFAIILCKNSDFGVWRGTILNYKFKNCFTLLFGR